MRRIAAPPDGKVPVERAFPGLMLRWEFVAIVGVVLFLALAYWTVEPALRDGSETSVDTDATSSAVPTAGPNDPVLVGAGDISACTQDNDEATAKLLDQVVAGPVETVVFTAGDTVYESGTAEEYEQCYAPTWGRHKDRTRPALGNHEYGLGNADASFQYFGAALGDGNEGYYSYDLGAWHIVVLNSNDRCELISCDVGSPQEVWLRSDLEAYSELCTLAILHDPLFSSSARSGGDRFVEPLWEALYEYGVDVVVSGDEHNYERFAPQTPDGIGDAAYGIRAFVVGTGGNGLFGRPDSPIANSEIGDDGTYGVIKFTLHPTSYDWEFLPVAGASFRDAGSGQCHPAPPR
jgi:hypothetical protein